MQFTWDLGHMAQDTSELLITDFIFLLLPSPLVQAPLGICFISLGVPGD